MTAVESKTNHIGEVAGEASPQQISQWLEDGQAVLVDVREPDEHARERIAGATSLPLSRFDPRQLANLVKPGQRIVIHCRSGSRAADACRRAASLASQGLTVVNMVGGIEAWKKSRLPVEVDASVSRISVMRQVQLVIGVGVLGGAALTWFVHPGFIVIPTFFGAGLTFAGATGTCALASLLGKMPWNRTSNTCGAGTCG